MGGRACRPSSHESLRHNPTDAEKRLWHHLRNRQLDGHRFRRQVPLSRYVVDFACLEARVVIEVDGGQHGWRAEADAARTAWLEANGFRVLRFWNNEVLGNLDGRARDDPAALTPHPDPPPQGGRENARARLISARENRATDASPQSRSGKPDAQAHRHRVDPGDRRRADRDRAGLRVRLLRHPGDQGAQGRGLPGDPGQLQPGHDHDRPGAGGCDLHRADHARGGRQDHRRASGPMPACRPWAARPRSTWRARSPRTAPSSATGSS